MKLNLPKKKTEEVSEGDRPHGTWQGTDHIMTDEEAHRDVRYSIPSSFQQMVMVFKTQMKLYSKSKFVYVLLVMAVLIPLIHIVMKDMLDLGILSDGSSNGMMGVMLSMLPFILGLFAASVCGKVMPTEFINRTAYMNMALPMSRTSFCIGKYLATLVVSLGVFVFAYGMALFTAMTDFEYFDEETMGISFILLLLGVFVYTATGFAFGCFIKKGAGILSFLLMLFVMPIVEIILMNNKILDMNTLPYFPNLLPDFSCLALGSFISASPLGMFNALGSVMGASFFDVSAYSIATGVIIGLIWGIALLGLGIYAVHRREM